MKTLVAGATGLIGQALVAQLQADPVCESLHLLLRRASVERAAKVRSHLVDFDRLGELPLLEVSTAFCALGTTIKVAGSKSAFRQVDFDYVLAVGQFAKRCGAEHFIVVSALGASAESRVVYSQVQGDMEAAVRDLGFSRLTLIRPSMLSGPRADVRMGERVALALMQPLASLIPAKYRAIADVAVARAMIDAAKRAESGVEIIESDRLQKFA